MNLFFVLVEPLVPENVGAAARALNTMGFNQLRIVNSQAHLEDRAHWVAHGSQDILTRAGLFSTLEAALDDLDFTVGTTAKRRGGHRHLYEPEALGGVLEGKGGVAQRVGIVFGREDRGLSNEELELCDLLTTIPLHTPYPSLNLGQAVMLYAYHLSRLRLTPAHVKPSKNPGVQLKVLKQRVGELILALDYEKDSKVYRWAQERLAVLDTDDVHFLHSLCAALGKKQT
jgi:tRNA/rRNA methyltransferase